jgi:hypothetical protein
MSIDPTSLFNSISKKNNDHAVLIARRASKCGKASPHNTRDTNETSQSQSHLQPLPFQEIRGKDSDNLHSSEVKKPAQLKALEPKIRESAVE